MRRLTPARVGLGRVGHALPTEEVLRFALAHAEARDAVHLRLDVDRIVGDLEAAGFDTCRVQSAAADRATYLARPDLGRRLCEDGRRALASGAGGCDVALVLADGLSSPAIEAHAVPLLSALRPRLAASNLSVSPAVVASEARVALGDEIGAILRARLVLVLIGERPGLSAPDSLGVYLTFAPRPGRTDAERNCISNIRSAGLGYELAAFKAAWLIDQALSRQLTGVALKDESDATLLSAGVPRLPQTSNEP
jgi:ethanolamine ammonia-lyase small subunit